MPLGGIRVENHDQFVRAIKSFGDVTMPDELRRVTQLAATFALRRVVGHTPVGNPAAWAPSSLPPPAGYRPGRARAGWQVGINRTTETDVDLRDPSGAVTIGKGVAKIKLAQPFDEVIIYNNVPYIIALENGSSTQAPAGMVKVTIAELALIKF